MGALPRSTDAPGAAGDQLGAGDEVAGLEGFLDGGLVGLACGLESKPLGGEGVFVGDLDGLGLPGGQLVIREREAGGSGLQAGQHQDQRVLEGIGAGGIGAGQLREPLGLLLAVRGLAAQVLDHPAGGIGLGGEGLLVAFLGQQGSLQFGEGLGAAVVVVGFQLLGQLADGSGELLGLDAQLPEGAGALESAGRARGLWERWGEMRGGEVRSCPRRDATALQNGIG